MSKKLNQGAWQGWPASSTKMDQGAWQGIPKAQTTTYYSWFFY
jgi:hypothetical protein